MIKNEVLAIVKFRPDKRSQGTLIREFGKLLCDVRQQRGCLHFDLYRSADTRDWFIHQIWEDQRAYEHYQHSPQATRLRLLVKERSTTPSELWRLEIVPLSAFI